MKKFIIAILVSVVSLSANAEWAVTKHLDAMTDETSYYSLSNERYAEVLFSINCNTDGSESMFLWGRDYIGISTVNETVYAVDGMVFKQQPYFKRLRLGHFSTASPFNMDIVAAMTLGKELRLRQLADYEDSSVYKFDLEGFPEAYAEWGHKCSEFY